MASSVFIGGAGMIPGPPAGHHRLLPTRGISKDPA